MNQLFTFGKVRNIALIYLCPSASAPYLLLQIHRLIPGAIIVNHYRGTTFGKFQGNCLSNATRSSCDKCYFSFHAVPPSNPCKR